MILACSNFSYGTSKLVAEKIHDAWQLAGKGRRLIVVRPGVVFGAEEHGNMTHNDTSVI